MQPLVSICCVTYNHADTIAQALDSFLAQREDVPVEILVHDDASTDGTMAILADYAARYPDVVKPLYETENQYSKGIAMDATFNFPRAQGMYIALCEGDDYWCDPHKLQKQIDCLQSHPGSTFCFTNGYVEDVSGLAEQRAFIPYYPQEAAYYAPETRPYSLGDLTRLTFIPTASFLFPAAALAQLPNALLTSPCPMGDLRLKLLLTGLGHAVYLHAFTCVYRFSSASSAMAKWGAEPPQKTVGRCRQVLALLAGVDEWTQGRWHNDLQRLMDVQWRVLLEAAPSRALLRDAQAKEVYRAMPLMRRVKYQVKAMVPPQVFAGIKRLLGKR